MKMKTWVSFLMVGVIVGSLAFYAGASPYRHGHGNPGKDVLSQWPAEKEMLFHQTMRDARDNAKTVKEEVRKLRGEMKELLAAAKFDDVLYREKSARIRELRNASEKVMGEAIVTLAKQFNQDERKILAQLISKHPMRRAKVD